MKTAFRFCLCFSLTALFFACTIFRSPAEVHGTGNPTPSVSPGPSGQKPEAKASQWVNGYYVGYNRDRLSPDEIYWEGLTHISVGAVTVIDAAENDAVAPVIDKSFYLGDETQGTAFASNVAALARQHGVIPILMLGGMDNGDEIRNATAPATFNAFVDDLIATARGLGFQGIDLDWEDYQDWDRFFALVKALRERAPEFILTMPIGNLNPNTDLPDENVIKFAPYLDQINVMSYFGCGTVWYGAGWYSGHGSALMNDGRNPVSIDYTLNSYADAGIDKKKLGMGIGFYGFSYADGINGPGQTGSGTGGVIADVFRGGDNECMFADLYTSDAYLYSQSNGCVKWDDTAKCAYLSLPADHPDQFGCRYVSFENERSIMEKGKYCRDNGFGGTIVWTIDQGYVRGHSDPNFLMTALRKGFFEPACALTPALTVLPNNRYVKPSRSTQFRALITGTDDLSAAWNATGGSISQDGLYTAGGTDGSFVVSCASNGLSSTANATVSSLSWTPTITLTYTDSWWKELRTSTADIATVKMIYEGTVYAFDRSQYNDTVFTANFEVIDGSAVRFAVEAEDGRRAASGDFTYRVHADRPQPEYVVPLSDE
jgi:chitinase